LKELEKKSYSADSSFSFGKNVPETLFGEAWKNLWVVGNARDTASQDSCHVEKSNPFLIKSPQIGAAPVDAIGEIDHEIPLCFFPYVYHSVHAIRPTSAAGAGPASNSSLFSSGRHTLAEVTHFE
jgi:hypothetical protein